jgi:hypothetical protein
LDGVYIDLNGDRSENLRDTGETFSTNHYQTTEPRVDLAAMRQFASLNGVNVITPAMVGEMNGTYYNITTGGSHSIAPASSQSLTQIATHIARSSFPNMTGKFSWQVDLSGQTPKFNVVNVPE